MQHGMDPNLMMEGAPDQIQEDIDEADEMEEVEEGEEEAQMEDGED